MPTVDVRQDEKDWLSGLRRPTPEGERKCESYATVVKRIRKFIEENQYDVR